MTDINHLLKKYSKNYVRGEKRSTEYERIIKQKQAIKDKKNIAETLFNEVPFHLSNHEKEHVIFLIESYPNLKKLHQNAKTETIILAFIFYVKMSNKQIRLERYTITEKYQLTHTTFELIVCRLVKYHFLSSYILPKQPETKQHDIIKKGDVK